jgi:hypothetical protein
MDAKPWVDEPDRLEWRHNGVPCLIVRNDMGALCGYVAAPLGTEAQVWAELGEQLEDAAHGGITFSGPCREGGRICHAPAPGEPDAFWYGFDCAHSGDLVPWYVEHSDRFPDNLAFSLTRGDVYRDVTYVKAACERMAELLVSRWRR